MLKTIPGHWKYYMTDEGNILDGVTGNWLIAREDGRGELRVNMRILPREDSMLRKVKVSELIERVRAGEIS